METKTAEQLKDECAQITQEILSLASLGDIMRAKEICEKVIQYGHDMSVYGGDTVWNAMKVDNNMQ